MQPHQRAAVAQVVLEGAPLPAEKAQLVAYARRQKAPADVVAAIERIEDRSYTHLDEVGEALVPHQPPAAPRRPRMPQPESGAVPGGRAYVDAAPEPGRIRDAPDTLPYEEQLVREPAPVGEGIPEQGSKDTAPGAPSA
jgi:hypothetical protein